ncbi:MAG TPA: DUF1192 domain-containing protein [Rhodospirillales bacterium]|nr:DUF1192 domain-containing protein [Rhodospirillales bacterium]
MDEDEVRPKRTAPELGGSLERLSVEELEAYIETLKQEIARVEAELARKRGLRDAAEALFGRRD